uniref:Acyl-CoA dehydrogenase/oxidase N-terminal domain-containing protein n=1 Tax=Meloidogyne incognita TaxID=6306 RepID=A0A914KXU6_MELIC
MTIKLSHRLLSNKLILSLMRNAPLFSSKRSLSFDLTEQQKKLKNKAKQFSKQTIMPKAVEYDTKVEFPSKIIKQVHSRGLMNSLVPVEYGFVFYLVSLFVSSWIYFFQLLRGKVLLLFPPAWSDKYTALCRPYDTITFIE